MKSTTAFIDVSACAIARHANGTSLSDRQATPLPRLQLCSIHSSTFVCTVNPHGTILTRRRTPSLSHAATRITLTSPDNATPPPLPPPQQEQQGKKNRPIDTAIAASLQTQPEHPDFVTVPLRQHGVRPTTALPSGLVGSRLLRMGPGVFDGVTHSDGHPWWVGHWFDGLSVIHEFLFSSPSSSSDAATVRYRSRYLAEQVPRTVRATPSWRYRELTFGPSSSGGSKRSAPRKVADMMLSLAMPATDPDTGKAPEANISVLLQRVGDRGLCVRTDGSMCVSLAYDDDDDDSERGVNPGEFFKFGDLDKRLGGTFAASHAGVDHNSGDMFNFVFGLDTMDSNGDVTYTIFRLPCSSDGNSNTNPHNGQRRQHSAQILTSYKAPPVYMHSVALTPTYVVLMHWPMRLEPLRMLRERCLTGGMSFSADSPAEFRLVNRETGALMRTVTADAAFAFHVVNAFDVFGDGENGEEGEVKEVCVDVCAFENGVAIIDALELKSLRVASTKDDLPNARLVRYTLPVNHRQAEGEECNNKADVRVLHERYVDLPTMAPSVTNSAAYRYVYGVAHDVAVFDSVVKIDVGTGAVVGRWGGRQSEDGVCRPGDMVVGEAVFVGNEDGRQEDEEVDEDDGVLLIVATQRRLASQREEDDDDEAEWRSTLVVVCARTMQTVARATLPYVVPLGFHGTLLRT